METYNCIHGKFPSVIADLILGYFRAKYRTGYSSGRAGEYEVCIQAMSSFAGHSCLEGACRGGHLEIVKFFVENYAVIKTPMPIFAACDDNHVDIVKYLYEKGYLPHSCSSDFCTRQNIKALEEEIENGSVKNYLHNFVCHKMIGMTYS